MWGPAVKRYIPARIVLFPGMGADPRMFARLKARLGDDVESPDWLMPERDEPFDHYAKRFADKLQPEPGDDRPLFLGGVSFGGMVALQVACHLRPEAVILIGSCRSRHAKPPRWRVAKRVGGLIPLSMFGPRVFALAARWVATLDQLDEPHRRLLIDMARRCDPYHVRWTGYTCADWTFDPAEYDGFPPIHQVHGRHDAIIPLHPGDPDKVIEDGRHILPFSHEQTVHRYIMDVVRRYA